LTSFVRVHFGPAIQTLEAASPPSLFPSLDELALVHEGIEVSWVLKVIT